MCAAVTCASLLPNGSVMFVRRNPPASPRFVSHKFSFDCSTFTASFAIDERAATSCTPPMWPYADTDATTAPGISSMERSRSRMTTSSCSPIVSGDSGTAMRSALARASMMSVDKPGTFDGAGRSAPQSDGFAAAAGFDGTGAAGAFRRGGGHRRQNDGVALRRLGKRDEALVEHIPIRELLGDVIRDPLRLRQVGRVEEHLPRFIAHVDEADQVAAQVNRCSEKPVARRLEHHV